MMNISSFCEFLSQAKLIDLSQTYEEHMPNYPTHSKFFHNLWGSYWHGDRSLSYQIVMNEHNGTHVDAPAHFISDLPAQAGLPAPLDSPLPSTTLRDPERSRGGGAMSEVEWQAGSKPHAHVTIDQVPLKQLAGRGARLDCGSLKEGDFVSKSFVQDWESRHGELRAKDIVLFNFGWSAYWGLRPNNQRYLTDWPGVSMEAAEYLAAKPVAALGTDTLSPDPPQALRTKPIHPVILEKQVLIIENLSNLDQLPDFFVFLAFPLKIRGGSGSPIRAVALV